MLYEICPTREVSCTSARLVAPHQSHHFFCTAADRAGEEARDIFSIATKRANFIPQCEHSHTYFIRYKIFARKYMAPLRVQFASSHRFFSRAIFLPPVWILL